MAYSENRSSWIFSRLGNNEGCWELFDKQWELKARMRVKHLNRKDILFVGK